jgi:hypothetical protein
MIKLNGKKFAANNKEFVLSLLKSGGTCNGYYKPLKNRVKLFDAQMNLIGSVTCYNVLAKYNKAHKNWSHGVINEVGVFTSAIEESKQITNILAQFNIERKY